MLVSRAQGKCDVLGDLWFLDATSDLLENRNYTNQMASIYVVRARVYQQDGNMLRAAEEYEMALSHRWRLDIALSLTEKYLILGMIDKAVTIFSKVEIECLNVTKGCVRRKVDINYLKNRIAKRQ